MGERSECRRRDLRRRKTHRLERGPAAKPDSAGAAPQIASEIRLFSRADGSFSSRFPFCRTGVPMSMQANLQQLTELRASLAGPRVDLFTTLYAQLRRIAQGALRRSGPHLTVSPTTLLHEAYLKLSNRDGAQFPDRARFMAYAARTMRRLVIDFVRERRALKRGAAFEITSLPTDSGEWAADEMELTRIGDALDELAALDAALAELVDLRFFCGFSFAEIAAMRAVSERTVQRDWNKARLYLHDALSGP
jgi:RNA polymerase sigma factor (TIGR02999 family)